MGNGTSTKTRKSKDVFYDLPYSLSSAGELQSQSEACLDLSFALLSGELLPVTLGRKATAGAARRQIAALCCVPEHTVHLVQRHNIMEDGTCLAKYHKETVQVVLKSGRMAGNSVKMGWSERLKARSSLVNPLPLDRGTSPFQCSMHRSSTGVFRFIPEAESGTCHVLTASKFQARNAFLVAIQGLESFRGIVKRSRRTKEYHLFDDGNDPSSAKTEQPRRQLGILRFLTNQRLGPIELEFVMPRVEVDGACAQFRKDSMLQLHHVGQRKDLHILRGCTDTESRETWLRIGDDKVFEARPVPDGWSVQCCHPLSCYQAFCIALSVSDDAKLACIHG